MKKNLHEICVEAVNEMVKENISHHVSYISGEDAISFGLKEGGKIPKVTIEWVEAEESYPKPGDPGYDAFVENHGAVEHRVQSDVCQNGHDWHKETDGDKSWVACLNCGTRR